MRRILLASLVIAGLATAPASAQMPAAPRVLTLSFDPDGRVNLKAQSVTIREILSEWARQCGCYVVNAQAITGGPIALPFQFEHAPQRQVLESLLRQVSGYTLTPRRVGSTSVSLYETIHITATSVATQTTYSAPIMTPTPDDEIPPVVPSPLRVDPNTGQPPGTPPQQPAAQQPQQPAAPRAPGVSVPIVGVPIAPTPGSASPPPRQGGPGAPAPAPPGTPTGR
jgi:hypothetical protein